MEGRKDGTMMVKVFGAILVIAGCGGFGFSLAAAHHREEHSLRKLIAALDLMECELQYRLTPLPDLCMLLVREIGGALGSVFSRLARELEAQISPDVNCCMRAAIAKSETLPKHTEKALIHLGRSLGRFDLDGQVKGLEAVRSECRRALDALCNNKDHRIRSYQTLGLCAGAAIVILFI